MTKIIEGIGDKFALLIQLLSSVIAGFVIAFAIEWRLTLFMIAFTPFMIAAGGVLSKVRHLPHCPLSSTYNISHHTMYSNITTRHIIMTYCYTSEVFCLTCLFVTLQLTSTYASKEQTAYAKAASIAEEVLSSIRTVISFGGEHKELDRLELQIIYIILC